jgi:hypothetical protein
MEVNTVDKIDCMEVNAVNKKEIKKTHSRECAIDNGNDIT